jgi:dihydrolipoamide dehydrogenase
MIYDLIVLGGGPAGYLACERAGHAGLKTLLIEKRNVGGVCLNEGCIPSKALLYCAKAYDYAKSGKKYGFTAENLSFDHSFAVKRKDKVVRALVGGVTAKLKGYKVEIVNAEGRLAGKKDNNFIVKAEDKEFSGKRLLIATGSMPVMPPIPGLKEGYDSGYVLTNREILSLDTAPQELVVVGGGVIGLEMASYFGSIGTKVKVIEMLDHIAGQTDEEIGQILLNNYKKKGIEFNLSAKVVEIKKDSVVYEKDGKKHEIKADKVLVSIGRRPVVNDMGFESIGLDISEGKINTDENGRTQIPNVYAAGDVNGYSMLAHTAYREAEVCINHILGKKDRMRYNAIPSVIYTNPEVAGVGETEATAKEKGIDYRVVKLSMKYSGRYLAENPDGNGICKVIVNNKYNNVIGVHMIGNPVSEIIYGAGLMIETEMKVEDLQELVFPHPTVCEIIRESLFE